MSKYPKMQINKERVRFCFPFREDLMHFEEEAKNVLSEEAFKHCEISDYPRRFFWFSLIHTSKEECVMLVELAHKIVDEI